MRKNKMKIYSFILALVILIQTIGTPVTVFANELSNSDSNATEGVKEETELVEE